MIARDRQFQSISLIVGQLFGVLLGMIPFAPRAIATDLETNTLYRSAHYLGRGDTGVGDADSQEAIFYNPAGLAQGTGIFKRAVIASPHLEVSSSTREIYNRLIVDEDDQVEVLKDQIGKPLHIGANNLSGIIFRRAALGATVSNQGNLLVRKDPEFGGLETVDAEIVANQILNFSLAEGFFGNTLLIGATSKYVNRSHGEIHANIIDAEAIKDIQDSDALKTGKGVGFDMGLMWKPGANKRLTEQSFGLTVSDVGDTSFKADPGKTAPDPLKQTLNLGYTLSLGTKVSRLKLLTDFKDVAGNVESSGMKRLHLGSEIVVADFIGISGGLNQGYPCAGIYADIRFFRVDLGFYTEERGERVGMYPDQRYYLRLLVGL